MTNTITREQLLSEAKSILASIDRSKYSGDPEECLMDIHSDICCELEEKYNDVDEHLFYDIVNDAIYGKEEIREDWEE